MNFGEEFSTLKIISEDTVEIENSELLNFMRKLRNEDSLHFEELIDLCGVDYLDYGKTEWETSSVTSEGFSRGVKFLECKDPNDDSLRFAVVYHLLSIKHNKRIRVRCFADYIDSVPMVNSVIEIWNNANWYEREAFDLFGILFDGHPDLRRILTDYGFIGHPFRKDFPLSGKVEVKYDEKEGRVVYQPVSIEPRVLVPKVIRDDSRYVSEN